MKILFTVALLLGSIVASADQKQTCFQLGTAQGAFSQTPDVLCIVSPTAQNAPYFINLSTGKDVVAQYKMTIVQRARCADCNMDIYAVANRANSALGALTIRFNGKRDWETMQETGEVSIGGTVFRYIRLNLN